MSPRFPSIDPDRIFHELEDISHKWVDLNAAATLLEDCDKVILSQIEVEYRKRYKTASEASVLAKADPRYRAHVVSACSARQAANHARYTMENLRTRNEMLRTQASTERAAMQLR